MSSMHHFKDDCLSIFEFSLSIYVSVPNNHQQLSYDESAFNFNFIYFLRRIRIGMQKEKIINATYKKKYI